MNDFAKILGQLQGVDEEKLSAIDELIASQQQPTRRGVRAEGQTWGGVFKDPTDAQREGFLSAGLALLGSSDNENLSQRIGQAIGQGVGAIRETRESDAERGMAAKKLKLQKLGIQSEGLQNQFNSSMSVAEFGAGREDARATAKFRQDQLAESSLDRAAANNRNMDSIEAEKNSTKEDINIIPVNGDPFGAMRTGSGLTYLDGSPIPSNVLQGARIEKIGRTEHDPKGVGVNVKKHVLDARLEADISAMVSGSGLDLVMNPLIDEISGRFEQPAKIVASRLIAEDQRALQDSVKKQNNIEIFPYTSIMKPMSDPDREVLKDTFKINLALDRVSQIEQKVTTAVPLSLSKLQSAWNNTGGPGDLIRIKTASGLGQRMLSQSDPSSESQDGTKYLFQTINNKWLPQATEQSSNRGYLKDSKNRSYDPAYIQAYANKMGYTYESVLKSLQLEEY